MIRYLRAVFNGEEKGFSNANRSFLRNIIAAVVVFLSIAIVKGTFNVVEKASEETGSTSCVSCFITGNCESKKCIDRGELKESEKSKTSKSNNTSN